MTPIDETKRRLQEAAAAIRSGDLGTAEQLLQALRASADDDPDVWQLSGTLHMRRQRPGDAVRAYLKATELAPDFAAGWVSLFRAREAANDPAGARQALQRACECAPQDLNLTHALGDFLYRHGHRDEALEVVERLHRSGVDDAGLWSFKAAILEDSGRLPEAETAAREALAREARAAPLHLQLARILEARRALGDALERYREALALDGACLDARIGQATTLAALGRYDDAIDALRSVLESHPDHPRAHYLLGSYLESNHRLAEAEEVLARGLSLAPENAPLKFALARCVGRRGDPAAALARLDAIPEQAMTAGLRISLYAERGQLHDRLGKIAPAMADFERANAIAAEIWSGEHPGPNPVRARLQRVLAWMNTLERAPWPAAPCQPDLAFLVGFPRTGTTLIGRMLDAHPDCEVLDEFPTVGHLARILSAEFGPYPEALTELRPQAISRLAATYHAQMARFRGSRARLLVDKLPMNTQYLPLIRRLFPGAPIIYATRHPLAACLSCYMQPFQLNPAMANFFTLAGCAAIYRLTAEVRRADGRLWADAGLREVRYETVVTELEASARGLLDFLGLPWSDRVLDFSAHARATGNIRTPSYRQVSEGVYRDALDRWRRYRSYLGEIEVELADEIRRYAKKKGSGPF